ncbi:hypothetical protein NXX21_22360 [Bacteroides thetaiotaomicron]|uniref:hypothetical protein n=1 Tax=Bacteroides thetaiotaomicron TaxID=818 RepID=UPI002166C033|nr:hypothetical protein [Bacteroides thetaiotaomicron]MCS2911448.1 hypothetical protein [Bacteroides thetaiotaomicron]
MSNDLNRSIKIYIDGTEAALGVKQVETAIQKLENKLASLNKSEANYNTQSRKLQQEINKKTTTLEKYKQSIRETERILSNLSGATYNELISVQSKVRKQLRDAIPGTQQHSVALEQNRRVTELSLVLKQQCALKWDAREPFGGRPLTSSINIWPLSVELSPLLQDYL